MRLIDADALKKRWRRLLSDMSPTIGRHPIFFESVIDNVDRQPTIEAELKWIPVTERLPEDWTDVLTLLQSGGCVVAVKSGRHWRERWSNATLDRPPTHWIPLPKPPENGGNNDA